MDLIIKKRAHGKTTDLINMSAATGIPIVCLLKSTVKEKAREMGVEIPEPIAYRELIEHKVTPSRVYIDELELFLSHAFDTKVDCATVSSDDECNPRGDTTRL